MLGNAAYIDPQEYSDTDVVTLNSCLFREPDAQCPECSQMIRQINELKADVGYWKKCHEKAADRENTLKQKIDELQAKVKLRERQLFSRKTEKARKSNERYGNKNNSGKKRKRGQQPNTKGHGRRKHDNLPVKEEFWDLSEEEKVCEQCGLPFDEHGGTEDSEVVEIEVKAHRRRIRRKRYKRACSCKHLPQIITAPPAPKLIPKGGYGISCWVSFLLGKFLYQRPLCRMLTELRERHGIDISAGTITGGFKYLQPLFVPLYEEIVKQNLTEGPWHADETRWLVFAEMEGKNSPRWYLWVFCTKTTVVFRLEPTRSSDVPKDHFGRTVTGFLVVDRYSAYKVLIKDGRILLAFCWAHVRRDFLSIAKDWPKLEQWAMGWVERIGELYVKNDARLKALDQPEAFGKSQKKLETAVQKMVVDRDEQLDDESLHPAARKALESLERHWSGLTLFVVHPEVPMDNNYGEQQLRNPVVGRKNYYGSGAIWSAALSAILFSVFQTLRLWKINPDLWLTYYLTACAENGGKPPDDAADFLPWNMCPMQRRRFTINQPAINDSS